MRHIEIFKKRNWKCSHERKDVLTRCVLVIQWREWHNKETNEKQCISLKKKIFTSNRSRSKNWCWGFYFSTVVIKCGVDFESQRGRCHWEAWKQWKTLLYISPTTSALKRLTRPGWVRTFADIIFFPLSNIYKKQPTAASVLRSDYIFRLHVLSYPPPHLPRLCRGCRRNVSHHGWHHSVCH